MWKQGNRKRNIWGERFREKERIRKNPEKPGEKSSDREKRYLGKNCKRQELENDFSWFPLFPSI